MELSDTQKDEVAAWFAAGASLDEIQKRIKAEFGIHMTYLDVRLLVAELPQPKEAEPTERRPPAAEPPEAAPAQDETATPAEDAAGSTPLPEDDAGNEAQTASAPTVTIDALMIPGTIASGDVTFSDGQTGKWYLDQMGRLGLGGDLPQGYRPSPTDAALFQQQLMQLLQSKGLC